ncbi:hypothetical protein CY34DRAFT_99565, partial [Suillus luteus UH-Slu-Lm8-n1]
ESQRIEIGDCIEVLMGEHMGKRGVVTWFPIGGTQLWFRDESPQSLTLYYMKYFSRPPIIQVPVAFVQRTRLAQTIKFTKEKGYDLKPGDVVRVARGPEYQTKGIVQSIDVPIGFVMKILNASLNSFSNVISQEVFVVGGGRKGFRATLYGVGGENCTVAFNGQASITLKCHDVVTSQLMMFPSRYGMRLNGLMLGESDLIAFCNMRKRSYLVSHPRRFITPPGSPRSSSNRTVVSPQHDRDGDIVTTVTYFIIDPGPLPWFMSKQFSSLFLTYQAMFTVSPRFDQAKFNKRFVSTACPDPFCGANGPAPEGCVAVSCTSSRAGAALEHFT